MSLRNKDFIAAGKYKAIRKIGSGSFGEIYTGINTTNGEVSEFQPIVDMMFHFEISSLLVMLMALCSVA